MEVGNFLWLPKENVPSLLDCDELDLMGKIFGRLLGEFQISIIGLY